MFCLSRRINASIGESFWSHRGTLVVSALLGFLACKSLTRLTSTK